MYFVYLIDSYVYFKNTFNTCDHFLLGEFWMGMFSQLRAMSYDHSSITSLLRPPDRPCCKFLLPSCMGRRLGILHFQEPPRLGLVWCWKNDLWNGCEMKDIAKQGEDSVTYSTLDLKLLKPWTLDHKITTGFQRHQDTLGSSGYSDSKTWGSRSAVDAPRFKAFGTSSWFNGKTTHKTSWGPTYRNSFLWGKQKPQRKSAS